MGSPVPTTAVVSGETSTAGPEQRTTSGRPWPRLSLTSSTACTRITFSPAPLATASAISSARAVALLSASATGASHPPFTSYTTRPPNRVSP